MGDTVKVVVVDDGLTYKAPGQKEPEPPKTYVTLMANRGDEIEVDQADADRFTVLGAVAEPGSETARVAKAVQHRTGTPYGAVAIAPENDNTAVQKIERQARELGLLAASQNQADDDSLTDVAGVSAAVPDDLDTSDEHAVAALNVQQLKRVAQQRGIEVEADDRKPDLVRKITGS